MSPILFFRNKTQLTSNRTRPQARRVTSRQGGAVVEFAIALPILFLIIFGSIQACNAIFTQQLITEVSYQGAITAAKPSAAKTNVIAEMNQILAARGINNAVYQVAGVNGTDFDVLAPGQSFRVAITVPSTVNQSGPPIVAYSSLIAESFGQKQ